MPNPPTSIGGKEPRSYLESLAGGKGIQQVVAASQRKEKSDELLARTYQWLIHNRSKTTLGHVTDMLRDADFSEERANAVVESLVLAMWYFNAPGTNRLERMQILDLELEAAGNAVVAQLTGRPAAEEAVDWTDGAALEDAEDADDDTKPEDAEEQDDPEEDDGAGEGVAVLDLLYQWAQEDEEARADLGRRDFGGNLRWRNYYNAARQKLEVEMSIQRDIESGAEIVDFGEVKALIRKGVPVVDLIDRMGPQFGVALAICNGSLAHDHINRRHVERAIAQVAEDSSYEGTSGVKLASGVPGRSKGKGRSPADDAGE